MNRFDGGGGVETYDICILAHPSDAAAAERLTKSLLGYRLPKQLQKSVQGGYRRIVLDVAGEPFSSAVSARLDASAHVVVLCSPEARAYPPLLDRLRYMEETRGRRDLIPVILRGEPMEAFPSCFIEETWVRRMLPDGSVVEQKETLEPVASDLRASSKRQEKALLSYETVRIVASVLGLEPDALQQRHARRARRRGIAIATTACALGLAVSSVFLYFALMAKREGAIAAAMAEESTLAVDRLVRELPERFAGDEAATARVQETIDEAINMCGDGGAKDPSAS